MADKIEEDKDINYIRVLNLQKLYSFCFRCKRFKRIYAKNLCKYCYSYSKYKDNIIRHSKKWNERNPDYFKQYYIKNKKAKDE